MLYTYYVGKAKNRQSQNMFRLFSFFKYTVLFVKPFVLFLVNILFQKFEETYRFPSHILLPAVITVDTVYPDSKALNTIIFDCCCYSIDFDLPYLLHLQWQQSMIWSSSEFFRGWVIFSCLVSIAVLIFSNKTMMGTCGKYCYINTYI